ncbi:MAG TPA: hypothetical protein VJZ69_02465 [Clostridia bacterium]|nr:hypothetical protein [Clostridia bacterium]
MASEGKASFRCFVMFLVSGFFVALNVVAYLITIGKVQPIGALPTIGYFDAISWIISLFSKDGFQSIINLFKTDWFNAIAFFSPIILLVISAVTCIKDLTRMLSGSYSKAGNFISKALICAAVLFMCCFSLIVAFRAGGSPDVMGYFKNLYATDTLVFTAAMVGIGGFALSILFAIMPIKPKYR